MFFTQIEFIVFFLLLLSCLYVAQGNKSRKIVLLIASYYFYAYWDWRFLCLLLIITFSDYQIGKYLHRSDNSSHRKILIFTSILFNLSILFTFKYCSFFVLSFQHLLNLLGIHTGTLSIILPLGISFYTFRTLSYTIDVYRHKLKPCTSLLDYAVFISFFPTMVAGPIVRASELLPQLTCPTILSWKGALFGFRTFSIGFFIKIFVADRIAIFTNYVFDNIGVFNSLTVWLAATGYSIQLYCDFAGYSMMAIGVARAIGYEVPENFNFPYLSKNISDFWKRWHITLSNWIMDYVYISLGGNRKSKLRTYVNLLFAMGLCGLWHGAAWTFAFWGLFHGFALAFHRIWTAWRVHSKIETDSGSYPFYGVVGRIITLLTVIVGWVFFRADGFNSALVILSKMFFHSTGVGWYHPTVLFILFSFILIQFAELFQWKEYHRLSLSAWYTPAAIFTMIWLCIVFGPKEFAPFIYSQF